MIIKPLKQYGEHQNEYSLTEVGDTLNDLIYSLKNGLTIEVAEVQEEKPIFNKPVVIKDGVVIKEGRFIDPKSGWVMRAPATGDKVYYVLDGKKSWVKNPETLFELGFNFSQVSDISNEELDSYETIDPVDMEKKTEEEVKDADKYNI